MDEKMVKNIIDMRKIRGNDELMFYVLWKYKFYCTIKQGRQEVKMAYKYAEISTHDFKDFENDTWVVEYSFEYNEDDETVDVYVKAGKNEEALAKNPILIVGDIVSIYDLKNNNFVLPIEKYIKKLEVKKESE